MDGSPLRVPQEVGSLITMKQDGPLSASLNPACLLQRPVLKTWIL